MKKKSLILHPFLIAMLPILLMYVHNLGEVEITELVVPLAIAVASSFLLWLVLTGLLHDGIRSALLTSLFGIWFLSFGHLASLAMPAVQAHFQHATRIFCLIYLALLAAIAIPLWLLKRGLQPMNSMLNFVAIGLVSWNVLNIAIDEIQVAAACRRMRAVVGVRSAKLTRPQEPPNIYYIILDGYARADVLKESYGFDNRDFLHYLKQKGFSVAEKSRSNYCQTLLSLTSSLNLDYLDRLAEQIGPDFESRKPLEKMFQQNLLMSLLRSQKYRTMAFSSGYSGTELRSSDIFINTTKSFSSFNQFLLFATPIPVALSALQKTPFNVAQFHIYDALQVHIQGIKSQFQALPDTTRARPPIFVFAHILCLHGPFALDRSGNITPRSESLQALSLGDSSEFEGGRQQVADRYIEQLRFVNNTMKTVIDKIIANSKHPPIIIIQADHGTSPSLDLGDPHSMNIKERYSIFLACYLPGKGDTPPADLSPVNLFRFILNRYFGAHFKLLKNENYYSSWPKPYRFIRVTDELEKDEKGR